MLGAESGIIKKALILWITIEFVPANNKDPVGII